MEELSSWTSRPLGTHRSLAWTKDASDYTFDGVNAIEQQFRLVNSDERLEKWRFKREEERRRRMDEALAYFESLESSHEDPLM